MLVPDALRPGDLIDVIAPSSPFDKTLAMRGLGWLGERYRLRFDSGMFAKCGYLAGCDERRFEELDRAVRATDSKAVVAARGGYGLHRIAHRVDWSVLRTHPKWLVGFSDATVLHVEAASVGVASMHASMVTALGRGDARSRSRWLAAMEHPLRAQHWSDLSVVHEGRCTGVSFGGNLTVLHACAAAGRLHIPPRAVVFLEDVGERPYRIDRVLSTLRVGGHFDDVVGFVVGEFTDCYAGTDNVSALDVVADVLRGLGVPVVSGFPIGHGLRNHPIPMGVMVEVEASATHAQVSVIGR